MEQYFSKLKIINLKINPMKAYHLLIISSLCFCSCNSLDKPDSQNTNPKGTYIDENLPDSIAKLYAPHFISTNLHERDFAMTPDGNEIYYTVMDRNYSLIIYSKKVNGEWTTPEIAPFSGGINTMDVEPFITSDGQKFFFMSTRPEEGQEAKAGWVYQNIWMMDRIENSWSAPKKMQAPINSEAGEYYPTLTNNGTIYFTREDGERKQSIYRSKLVDGKYQEAERLPSEVNASDMQYNSLIAPDESYLIVCTRLKENAIGRIDYCISFRTEDDKWTPLINMGNTVNFPACTASSPALSKDGKYFFFSSNKRKEKKKGKYKLSELKKNALSAQNGSLDIYWVEAKFIEDLKKDFFMKNK